MTKRDWLLFIFTLCIGMFTGMYLYFTTFVPAYISNPTMQELTRTEEPAWRMTVAAYGGCQMVGECPRFELTADGDVRFQPARPRGEEVVIDETAIPNTLRRQVDAVITSTNLAQASQVVDKTCVHWSDGIDYELSVDTEAGSYSLDTCYTALQQNDQLTSSVREVFTYLQNPDDYIPTLDAGSNDDRGGLGGYLERKLDETFDYDD